MKKGFIFLISIFFTLYGTFMCQAQSTEDFESETLAATKFTDKGQEFTITSNTGEDFKVNAIVGAGWNGTSIDDKFIDNAPSDHNSDGTSFRIRTSDVTPIFIKSLYVFLADGNVENPSSASLTITGKLNNVEVYSFTKSSGFADVVTFTPNNGYTFIDFATEGSMDYSNTEVDELVFTTTNDADYFALDAITWDKTVSSTPTVTPNKILSLFPNPTQEYVQIVGFDEAVNYSIYSVLGTQVKSGIIKNGNPIDVSGMPNGVYFFKLENGPSVRFIKR